MSVQNRIALMLKELVAAVEAGKYGEEDVVDTNAIMDDVEEILEEDLEDGL